MRTNIDKPLMFMVKSKVMKLLSTTPATGRKGIATKSMIVAAAVVMAVSGTIGMYYRPASADQWDDSIRAIEQEISQYQERAAELGKKADTLQNELANLAAQKATIQSQIDLSQAKYNKLVSQIEETERQISENKDALGEIIADMYVEGSVTPLEMLASSNNIGDYADRQAYQYSIQDTLTDTIDQIDVLKKRLEDQKVDVERVLDDQKGQRSQLAQKEAEQSKLLAETKGQESAYNQLTQKRNQQINELQEEQRKALQPVSGNIGNGSVGGGGYPGIWAYAERDTLVDDWGLYNRECVSYTAWKVASTGRYVPHFAGQGNANQWPSTTARHGIKNGYTPVAGSVAILLEGPYGHAMYVEEVHGGTIVVSDYNNNADGRGWGLYHRYSRPAAGLIYIYF